MCEFCEAKASTARGGLQEISVRKFTCGRILPGGFLTIHSNNVLLYLPEITLASGYEVS